MPRWLWSTAFAQRGPAGSSLGEHAGQDRFPRRQGRIERPRLRELRGQGAGSAELGGGGCEDWLGKWAMNQMLINVVDAQVRPFGSIARGRRSGACGSWAVEIGRLPPLRGAVGGAHEGVDGVRPLRPRFAGDPDRRHSHGRGSDPGRGDRCRREGRQASARPHRGRDGERRDRPGAHRQSRRARARPGGATALHHRRREGPVQGDPPDLRTLPRRSSAVRSTRPATLWSDCPNRCTLRSGVCCDKHGSWTMPTRPKSCSATSPNVSNETGPGSPARSWKASTKSSPLRGLDCRRSCGARSPVPTLSRM